MADLLRQGSTLTDLSCPACCSPLLRLKNGDLWCGKCEKKVIVVRDGEESKVTGSFEMQKLEDILLAKVETVRLKIQEEENAGELEKLNTVLAGLLDNLDRIRKTRKT
jgi:uncharacterized Zn finger protein (UPF0148 family)